MPIDRVQYISERSHFYRDGFRLLVLSALVLVGIAFLLMAIIFYQYFTRPTVHYFVTTSDGRLVEIYPVK
jgi:hypothetical protein